MRTVLVLAAVWAVLFAASFGAMWLIDPVGDGFTRGLNRVTAFLGWQTAALAVSLAAAAAVLRLPRPRERRILAAGLLPLAFSGLVALSFVALFGYAILIKPAP
jgi:hypothetical protein